MAFEIIIVAEHYKNGLKPALLILLGRSIELRNQTSHRLIQTPCKDHHERIGAERLADIGDLFAFDDIEWMERTGNRHACARPRLDVSTRLRLAGFQG